MSNNSIKNLLPNVPVMTFGTQVHDAVQRDTVVAVVHDPSTNTFLCQYWPEYSGLTCLLSGGIEINESAKKALEREIVEETGYTDFTVLGQLGAPIVSHYRKASSSKDYTKHITPYLVILNSRDQTAAAKEPDELFENMFTTPARIIDLMTNYEQLTGSSLADHKEILSRAILALNNTV